MRHLQLDGLVLDVADCRQLARLLDAAAALRDIGRHDDADELARLALGAGAVVAAAVTDVAAAVTDAGHREPRRVTLVEWAAEHEIPETTARRWARSGRIDAVRRGGRWWVPGDDVAS